MNKILLILLFLIPNLSWGHEDDDVFTIFLDEYCIENPEYTKWLSKNKKVLDKRNINYHKCILEHSKKGSSLNEETIMQSCWVISKDKFKTKGAEPQEYQHVFTKETGSSNICHKHLTIKN